MTRVSDQVSARWERLQDSRNQISAALEQPRPAVRLDLGPWVPCWLARLVAVGLGVAAIVVGHPAIFGIVVLAAMLVVVAVRTNTVTATTFWGLFGIFWLLGTDPSWPADAGLIALGLAGWMLAGMLSGLGAGARIELAALLPALGRYLVVQAITQPLLAGGLWVRSLDLGGPVVAIIALCCGAALAAAGWWIVPHLSRDG